MISAKLKKVGYGTGVFKGSHSRGTLFYCFFLMELELCTVLSGFGPFFGQALRKLQLQMCTSVQQMSSITTKQDALEVKPTNDLS